MTLKSLRVKFLIMCSPEDKKDLGQNNNLETIRICPYWRKYAIHVSEDGVIRVLALCGRAGNEGGYAMEQDLGRRVKRCPYFDDGGIQAYKSPTIIEFLDLEEHDYDTPIVTDLKGKEGVESLEFHWPFELKRFQADCDNSGTET